MNVRDWLLVAVGGACGAVARHLTSVAMTTWLGERFPWGTLLVNVLGCFLLGWLSQSMDISNTTKLAVGTGFLGAFTTFSTFGVQTLQTWQKSPWLGAANVMANVSLGIVAALIGFYVARALAAK